MNLFNPYIIKMYKLREWIDESQLKYSLSKNPNAVEYLEEHPGKINYYYLSLNKNAIHIIEKNLDKCEKSFLHENPNMVNLLRNNRSLLNYDDVCYYKHCIEFVEELIKNNELNIIDWLSLSCNSAAIHVLERYPEKINWHDIMYNTNAEHMIRNNLNKVEQYWYSICRQPHLISLIEEHPEKINWNELSYNYNAVHLLKNNLEKINVEHLRYNKNGFKLLILLGHQFDNQLYYEKNIVYAYWNHCKTHNIEFTLIQSLCFFGYTNEHFEFIKNHFIDYDWLSRNPNIFEYDYSRMKKTRQQQPWYHNIKNEFI